MTLNARIIKQNFFIPIETPLLTDIQIPSQSLFSYKKRYPYQKVLLTFPLRQAN